MRIGEGNLLFSTAKKINYIWESYMVTNCNVSTRKINILSGKPALKYSRFNHFSSIMTFKSLAPCAVLTISHRAVQKINNIICYTLHWFTYVMTRYLRYYNAIHCTSLVRVHILRIINRCVTKRIDRLLLL